MNNKIKKAVTNFITNELQLEIKSLPFIENGISNFNFLLNNRYVIKYKDARLDLQNSPNNEVNMSSALNKLGKTPLHNFYQNFVVIDYLENSQFLNKNNYELHLNSLVNLIQTVHNLPSDNFQVFDPFQRLNFYKSQTGKGFELIGEEQTLNEAAKYYLEAKKVPCHNDLVNGNILIKDDKLYLIDFEYCGLNDPDFDVVSFLSENDFVDLNVKAKFLDCYYHGEAPAEKLSAYFALANLLWYYWALYAYQRTKKAIFMEIAQNKKLQYLA